MESNVINISREFPKDHGMTSLTHHSTETRKKLLEFEALVAPSEHSAKIHRKDQTNMIQETTEDDPVVHWAHYIEFVASLYPHDERSILHDLRTRATRALIHLPKYSNDVRFLRICILAADSSPQPLQDFQALYDLGIGIKMACFWMVWAFKAEKLKEYHTATAVYIMALKYEAVPIKVVRQRYMCYITRMKKQGISYDPRRRKRDASPIISYDDRGSSQLDCSGSNHSSDSSEISKRRRRVTLSPISKPLLEISNHAQSTNTPLLAKKDQCDVSPHFNQSDHEMSYEMNRSNRDYYKSMKCMHNNFNLLAKSNVLNGKSICYDRIHKANVECALKDLSSKTTVHKNETLPLVLLKPPKKSKSKTRKVSLNGVQYTVKRLLGKGHYGTVVLLESDKDKIALKIQQPVSCLCWEYHILRQLSKRLSSKSIQSNFFPHPTSLTGFQNGATLALSVGSEAGLTLLDIVNIYKGSVPELLVIYYTRQLFQILQLLHLRCNILHCDIKPDQIVIRHQDNDFTPHAMLVDFGRAIDLKEAAKKYGAIEFEGNISVQGMECISMRKNLGWSYDVDFHGVIMSAFTLLFGEYVDLQRGDDSWNLSKPFKRYWNNHLWHLLLDTISIRTLNFDDYTALLDSIENAFGNCINERGRELEVIQRDQLRLLNRYIRHV